MILPFNSIRNIRTSNCSLRKEICNYFWLNNMIPNGFRKSFNSYFSLSGFGWIVNSFSMTIEIAVKRSVYETLSIKYLVLLKDEPSSGHFWISFFLRYPRFVSSYTRNILRQKLFEILGPFKRRKPHFVFSSIFSRFSIPNFPGKESFFFHLKKRLNNCKEYENFWYWHGKRIPGLN